MRIAIVGAGSIGLLLASYLTEIGHDVQLITRTKEQAKKITRSAVIRESEKGTFRVKVAASEYHTFKSIKDELVIVTLKQGSIAIFLQWAKIIFPSDVPIVFLQNGMGHIEMAKEVLCHSISAGIVTHGAYRKTDTIVKHSGVGEIILDGEDNQAALLNKLVTSQPSFPISTTTNMVISMKKKLLVNAIVNPITAIHQVKNGEILKDTFLKKEAKTIFQEVCAILGFPEDEWLNVVKVIEKTAKNQSSMLSDILKGHKTEIDAITGYLLILAERYGKELTKIHEIHNAIKRLEERGNV